MIMISGKGPFATIHPHALAPSFLPLNTVVVSGDVAGRYFAVMRSSAQGSMTYINTEDRKLPGMSMIL